MSQIEFAIQMCEVFHWLNIVLHHFNCLPNKNCLDLSKFIAFADDNLNNGISVLDRVENKVG